MAGIIHTGYIAKPGEDIFPTTGPHLDVRVKKGGQYIDPSTWRSGLQNLVIGEAKTPLYQQTQDGFKPSFPVTSGFGPRTAPTAGASTFHKGIDFGVPGGTPLYWKGAGAFKPGKGLGTIQTPEGYEIELLHTKGGQEASLGNQQSPQIQPSQQPPGVDLPQSINIVIQTGKQKEEATTPDQYLKDYIAKMTKPSSSPFSIGSLAKIIANQPTTNYFA